MNNSDPNSLAELLRSARQQAGLSSREVAKRAGVNVSVVLRLQDGSVASPRPDTVKAVAEVLDIDLSDAYAAAGYVPPSGLPSFSPYLRSKYADLPPAAQRELEQSFGHIAKKYGYDADGPAPGQDEQ